MSDSLQPYRPQPTRLLCSWDSPGKNTGVGCHSLDLPDPRFKSASLVSPVLAGRFFFTEPPGKPYLLSLFFSFSLQPQGDDFWHVPHPDSILVILFLTPRFKHQISLCCWIVVSKLPPASSLSSLLSQDLSLEVVFMESWRQGFLLSCEDTTVLNVSGPHSGAAHLAHPSIPALPHLCNTLRYHCSLFPISGALLTKMPPHKLHSVTSYFLRLWGHWFLRFVVSTLF